MRRFVFVFCIGFWACTPEPEVSNDPDGFSTGAALAATCAGCHSAGAPDMPDISNWTAEQIKDSLTAYRDTEGSTVMHRLARGYSDAEIEAIAQQWGTE